MVVGGIAWKLFKDAVSKVLAEHKINSEPINELRHNGGNTLLDVVKLQILPMVTDLSLDVKELRQNQMIIGENISKLEGRFEQHVDEAL